MGILGFLKKDKAKKRLAIIDVNDKNFKEAVTQRSYKTTVVVDFWAAWCGPCRMLGPILERIAEQPESQFVLAKLDTEHNQRIAAQFHIHSIPAIKAFRNGQIVDEFTGALPEPLVRRFLDKVTTMQPPAPRIQFSNDPKKRLQQGEQHLRKGRGFEAFIVLNEFPAGPEADRAEKLLPLARFLFDMADCDGLTGIGELDKHYEAAADSMKQRKPEQALDHLTAALKTGEKVDKIQTAKVIESLFTLLGEDNSITKKYRAQLVVE